MPIAPFPHRYIVKLQAGKLSSLPREEIHVGAPPQFGGSDVVWSPEELLVGAVVTCLQTTFDAYARRDSLPVFEWSATGTGILAKESGGPRFSAIELHVTMATGASFADQAEAVLRVAERNCIITHTLNCPIHLTSTVSELGEQRSAG